jgi:hypothetical protein
MWAHPTPGHGSAGNLHHPGTNRIASSESPPELAKIARDSQPLRIICLLYQGLNVSSWFDWHAAILLQIGALDNILSSLLICLPEWVAVLLPLALTFTD